MKLTDTTFESLYKDFLGVRSEWCELIRAISVHHDVSSEGDAFRHVGVTPNTSILARAQELLTRWQAFADIADAKRASGIHACNSTLYLPVPVIVSRFSRFTVNHYSATSVKKMRREDILVKLQNRLKSNDANPYNIPDTKRDIKTFEKFPIGTLFRVRISGYNDLFLDFYTGENVDHRVRVGAYGIMLDSTYAMQTAGTVAWSVNPGSKKYDSVYELLKPIRCSLFNNSEVYLLDEVERAKEISKVEAKKRARSNYEASRSIKNKAATLKRKAEKTASRSSGKAASLTS